MFVLNEFDVNVTPNEGIYIHVKVYNKFVVDKLIKTQQYFLISFYVRVTYLCPTKHGKCINILCFENNM